MSLVVPEHRLDLPPCRHCGSTLRWLNTGQVELAPYRWHCLACSPPPAGTDDHDTAGVP